MDFLKTLLAYMAATFVVAVESTSTPAVTPVPTPAPATTPATGIVEMITEMPTAEITATPTVSVTPVPVPTITPNMKGYHNLLQGDRGDDVRKMQERLIELGYLPEGSADGAFGGKTRNAVRQFQYYNGLTVDGIAGRTTQTNLFENPDAAPMPTPEPTPSPTAEPTPTPEATPTATENGEQAAESTVDRTEKEEVPKNNDDAETDGEKGIPETSSRKAGNPAETKSIADASKSTETPEPTVTPYVVAPPTEIPWGDEITASAGKTAEEDAILKTEEASGQETEEEQAGEPEEKTSSNAEAESGQAKGITGEPEDGSGEEASGEQTGSEEGKTALNPETETGSPEEETAEKAEEVTGQEPEEQESLQPEAESSPTEEETAEKTEEATGQEPEEQESLQPEAESSPTEEETTGKTEEAAGQEPEGEAQQPEEIIEEVDLDAEEAIPVPESSTEPEIIEYEELAGWVILNDSEESLQWTETEEGTPVVRSPRMERKDDDYRISLDDAVKCIEGWELHDEKDSLILEAQGYTLALLNETNGFAAMVDGTEIETDVNDFSFDEGHFIRVDFLTRALEGSWEWDAEEETLMIRIPGKGEGETSR